MNSKNKNIKRKLGILPYLTIIMSIIYMIVSFKTIIDCNNISSTIFDNYDNISNYQYFVQNNTSLNSSVTELNSQIIEYKKTISQYEETIAKYEKDISEYKREIEYLKPYQSKYYDVASKYNDLSSKYNVLQTTNTSLEDQLNDYIIASNNTSNSISNNTSNSISNSNNSSSQNSLSSGVYITRTGSKYHRGSCSYLRNSRISISRSNAIAQGYEPCSRCNP